MKTTLIAALTLLTTSLCAQDKLDADRVGLELRAEGSTAKLSAPQAEDKFFGVLLGSLSAETIAFPNLPSILATPVVLGAGGAQGAMAFDLGKLPQLAAAQGFEIHLQGVALLREQIVASGVMAIGGDTATAVDVALPAKPASPTRKPVQVM